MGRDPLIRHSIHSDRGYPGCMGGVPHLFDFNQALAGQRLLTDRKQDNGLEAFRNSLDVASGGLEVLKASIPRRDGTKAGYEIQKSSRKSNGMPTKALIDKELSKESESRNRTPNVVARLMGLDALPVDQIDRMKQAKVSPAEPNKNWQPERQFQEPKPPQVMKTHQKKVGSLSSQSSKESFDLRSHHQHAADWEEEKTHLEAVSFHKHPQEQQLQQFKRDFVARQSQKSWDRKRSAGLEEVDMEFAAQQSYASEKLNETKLATDFEEFSGANYNRSQEKLHESKEFLDAVDFLQSNKDLFIKFLQEPNSLFARHLHDNQPRPRISSQPTLPAKHKNAHKILDLDVSRKEDSKSDLHGREPLDPRSYKREYTSHRRLQADLVPERSIIQTLLLPSLDKDVAPDLFQNQETHFSRTGSDSKIHSADYEAPTRIVILKPSPGKVKNQKSLHSIRSPCSPTSLKDSREVAQDEGKDVLHELMARLRTEGKQCKGEDRRHALQNVRSHLRDGPIDPREIAREIARQVRESVTRDLLIDSGKSSNAHSTVFETGRKISSSRLCTDPGDIAASSDGEASTSSRKLFWDLQKSSPPFSPIHVKSLDAPNMHGSKEGRKRGTGRSKILNMDEKRLQEQGTSMKITSIFEDGRQVSVRTKAPYGSKAHTKGISNGFKEHQIHPGVDLSKLELMEADAVDDWDGSMDYPLLRSREENKDNLPKTLLRSRSVPRAIDRNFGDVQLKRETGASHMHETVVEKVAPSPVKGNKVRPDVTVRSTFSKKVSSLKGSFNLNRQRTICKDDVDGALLSDRTDTLESTKSRTFQESTKNWSFPVDREVSLHGNRSAILESTEIGCGATNGSGFKIGDPGTIAKSSSKKPNLTEKRFTGDEGRSLLQSSGAIDTHNGISEKHEAAGTALDYEDNKQHCSGTVAVHNSNHSSQNSAVSPPRVHYLSNETSRNTSEVSKEKFEQPSPVSVLDSPFQEEIKSPMNFKEISSDLPELRLRLHLLRFEDCGMSGLDLEALSNEYCSSVMEDIRTKDADSCLHTASEVETMAGLSVTFDDFEYVDIKNIGLSEGAYSTVRESEMAYVGAILIASGFTDNSAAILTRWHAPIQPLNPYLFQMMEDYCCKQSVTTEESTKADDTEKRNRAQLLLDTPDRRLLFDCVNEILLEMMGRHLNQHPLVMPSKVTVSSIPTGKELMKLISMEVCRLLYLHSAYQDTMENLVSTDLGRGSLWMDLIEDIDTVGIELEKAIFNELIDETIISLVKQ